MLDSVSGGATWQVGGWAWAHLGLTGLSQLPVGFAIGQQLLQAGDELVLLQGEAAGGCCGDAVVVDFGPGPDWEGTETEATSRLQPALTLPPPQPGDAYCRVRGGLGAGTAWEATTPRSRAPGS